MAPTDDPLLPTQAGEPGRFDRFSTLVAGRVAQAWFFCACVTVVLLWAPSFFLFGSVDIWQLFINTFTTIVTFLLVALLQNTQSRDSRAIHRKLNALINAQDDLMQSQADEDPSIEQDRRELQHAAGLEHREGS